jgi:hypothetical protein
VLPLYLVIAAAAPAPILVELYTSQGCSSCPAADRLLVELAASRRDVLALSFHVDYWNHLGWADPYSLPESTSRQIAYAELLSGGRVYTPQAIVDGTAACVGSDRDCITGAFERARAKPTIDLERLPNGSIRVPASRPEAKHVVIAWVQAAARNRVPRGENMGRELSHTSVVRGLVIRDAGAAFSVAVPPISVVPLDRVVVFEHDASRAVIAVGVLDLEKG